MTDVPFVVSALFSKTVQTAPYESEKAEVSAQFTVQEGVDATAAIENGMGMVKRQVLIALGKAEGELKAVATEPKRGPGRPPKDKVGEPGMQVVPDKKTEEKAQETKPAPKEDFADDFGDEAPKPVKQITDAELQAACSAGAKSLGGAEKVKNLFQVNFGAQRVSQIKPEERQKFLDELEKLVAANKKG